MTRSRGPIRRAVIYARASLDVTGEGRSVERQLEACRKLVDLREWDLVGFEQDNNVSAYSAGDRPGWEAIRHRMRTGQVDVVVAWHLDRLTRSMVELETLILEADKHDVAIATATGDIDLTTDTGRMVARILSAVARAEVERKSARQRLANQQRAAAGEPWIGGPRPFGYADGQTELVAEEADAVRQAAQDALTGTSLREIARRWDAAGLVPARTTDSPNGWSASGVKFILVSPRYAGLRTYKGVVVGQASWPAIISQSQHHALVQKFERQAAEFAHRGTKSGRAPATLLSGIMRCGVCDGGMRASSYRAGLAYRCPDRHVTVPRESVDQRVEEEVLTWLVRPGNVSALAASDEDDVEVLLAELDGLDTRRDELAALVATGDMTPRDYAAAVKPLTTIRDGLEARIGAATGSDGLAGLVRNEGEIAGTWAAMDITQRRLLVERVVSVTARQSGGRGRAWSLDEHLDVVPQLGDAAQPRPGRGRDSAP